MSKKLLFCAFLLGSLIAGCGHDPAAPAASPSGGGSFQQALDYAKCMRANGVPDFPDPQQQGGGVRQDVGKDLNKPDLTKAEEACRDKMPQGDAGADGGAVDAAKLVEWTKCMRAKLPNFPDPEVTGNTIKLTLSGTGIKVESAEFENTRRACESHFPGGSLNMVNLP